MASDRRFLGFDDYDFETLIVPALIVTMPVLVLAAYLGFSYSPWLTATIFGVEIVTVPFIASNAVIRNRGKAVEAARFGNVMPTTSSLLLMRGSNPEKKFNRELIERLSGQNLLPLSAEKRNEPQAIQTVNLAVNIVKEQLRTDFLLRRELKSYGFWRNMLGIKKTGLVVSSLTAVTGVSLFIGSTNVTNPHYGYLAVAALATLAGIAWGKIVSGTSLQASAERYAIQFFRSAIAAEERKA